MARTGEKFEALKDFHVEIGRGDDKRRLDFIKNRSYAVTEELQGHIADWENDKIELHDQTKATKKRK